MLPVRANPDLVEIAVVRPDRAALYRRIGLHEPEGQGHPCSGGCGRRLLWCPPWDPETLPDGWAPLLARTDTGGGISPSCQPCRAHGGGRPSPRSPEPLRGSRGNARRADRYTPATVAAGERLGAAIVAAAGLTVADTAARIVAAWPDWPRHRVVAVLHGHGMEWRRPTPTKLRQIGEALGRAELVNDWIELAGPALGKERNAGT